MRLPLTIVLLLWRLNTSDAGIACNATYNPCEELLYKGSECREGFCSNPFESGCLTTLLKDEFGGTDQPELLPSLARRLQKEVRVCNSEDPPDAATRGICVDHSLLEHNLFDEYMEVRILTQNWESAIFVSWIMQILLSEVLRVPTTVETGVADAKANFYSPTNDFGYGIANDWGALETANAAPNGDCLLKDQIVDDSEGNGEGDGDGYRACGHLISEFWAGNNLAETWDIHRDGVIDAPEGLGAIGAQALFVTQFTAQADPTVLNLLGIAGEANRRKLAETFLRPTTWGDYCELVSNTSCAEPDGVAQRAPVAEEGELDRMHVPGVYTGYFRATEENNCDLNPNCTGHVADFPCGWNSYVAAITHHHNIALKSSGPEKGSHGYSYNQLVEMYAAANETKSNLMTMWWYPEPMYSAYTGTDAEMQRVILPSPTEECVNNRINIEKRCSYETPEEQYGSPLGACDEAPQLLQKIIASGFYKNIHESGTVEAKLSPALEAIKSFKISELQLGTILQRWSMRNVDTYGFDPRHATCVWLRENLEYLEDYIPTTYPRVTHEEELWKSPLFFAAISFGALATLMTVVTTVLTYRKRTTYVMKFSQVEFLFILLGGLLFVSVGSILLAIVPQDWSCITTMWLLGLGYTLELVPLIVKVAAMNKMMTAAKRFKRIILTQKQLFGTVALFSSFMVLFLILWSSLDSPQRQGQYTLTDETDEDAQHVVTVSYYCESNSQIWRYVAVGWHCLLLICATVLAFQSRNLQAGFSEAAVLAMMIYSHFVFLLLRVVSFILEGTMSRSYIAATQSLIYSLDVLVTIAIYFLPKLLKDDDKFYALTHAAGKTTTGRGSVVTMSPSVVVGKSGSGGSSGASALMMAKAAKPTGGATDESDSYEEEPFTGTAYNNSDAQYMYSVPRSAMKSKTSKARAKKNVLGDNKVSWGGINCSTWAGNNDSESSSEGEDPREQEAPFQRPVDVLKSKDSWGGANLTMLIHSEEDASSHNGAEKEGALHCIAEVGDDDEESAAPTQQTRKSLLPPSSLPKSDKERFYYASSRINRTRTRHTASQHEDETPFRDEETDC